MASQNMTNTKKKNKNKEIIAVQRMKALFFTLWVGCVLATIGLAVMPGGVPAHNGADKMLHLLVFCILMLWPATTFDTVKNVSISAAALLVIGVCMEYLQNYIPGRTSELMDIVYNIGGIACGTVIGFLFRDTYQSLLPLAYVHAYIKPKSG